MKILIVDDDATNRLVLGAYLKKDGFNIVSANNGQTAVDLFQSEAPDLILMDIMMPVMDGYESTIKIKSLSGERFIPIIFLTAMTDENALTRCVEVGGDDFLTKPYNRTILKAKIDALERVSELYNTNQQQKQEIIARREIEIQEQEVARRVFDSILSPGCLSSSDNIQLHLSPMSLFNGDVVLAAVKPMGGLNILFGDFTGHGLAASLGALPVSNVFYTMTAKGYSIADIVSEVNRKLKSQLPVGMFLAACLVEIDTSNNVIKYWNGAIPAAYLMQENSRIELKSKNLPLGILGDNSFSNQLDLIEIHNNDKIVLSTDGILEAENKQGAMFGVERFLECLNVEFIKNDQEKEKPDLFDHILENMNIFVDGFEQTDDVTLAVINCDIDYINQLSSDRENSKKFIPSHWDFEMCFYYDAIKSVDPVPLINQILREIQGHRIQQDKLSTILSELFCNSLDHGLLRLDSKTKSTPEGFMQFYADKELRLKELDEGFIRISIKNTPIKNGGDLSIIFEDSGPGFDTSKLGKTNIQLPDTDKPVAFSGRGILLINNYCQSISYNEKGNRVECVYHWSNSDHAD
ncbi:MAG: fused response regulator/phosphatase [gamma proteobacterium symbiont of Taylorina sp.]|nr:fused response regulator/phosphatase [gamma proteobacterium symbiont of Taylorina sp.]